MSKLISALLLLFTTVLQAHDLDVLTKVHTLKTWPAISHLIEYRQRIWFVHSSPYQDTNVADIYSYNPASGTTRFERSLFSQDTGSPVVYQGLLYWPLEDPRRSAGVGEYAVTDGHTWQWRVMNSGRAMHVHAMEDCGDQLIAVTGSWTGQMLSRTASPDEWQLSYDYPAGKAAFSRLIDAEFFNAKCYLAGSANQDPAIRLLQMHNGQVRAVAGWPDSDRIDGLTTHNNKLYAWADNGPTRTLHAYDGSAIENITLPEQHRIRDLHSIADTLYMITSKGENGALWSLDRSNQFAQVSKLPFIPMSISHTTQHGIFISSYHRNGPSLWHFTNSGSGTENNSNNTNALLAQPVPQLSAIELEAIYTTLHDVISDPANGADRARNLRRALANPRALADPAFGEILNRLLREPIPDATVTLFTSRQVPWKQLVHWYLLSNIAINGHGRVEPALLSTPWRDSQHRSNKYFDPSVMAIVAAGWIKQSDRATVSALINRLANPANDPLWLQSDISGALTAITSQRFGRDAARWQQWFQNNDQQ